MDILSYICSNSWTCFVQWPSIFVTWSITCVMWSHRRGPSKHQTKCTVKEHEPRSSHSCVRTPHVRSGLSLPDSSQSCHNIAGKCGCGKFSRKDVEPMLVWPLQTWIYHCHLHPLQATNCCRNSRLVLNEDDLKWVTNEKNIVINKQFYENFRSKTNRF